MEPRAAARKRKQAMEKNTPVGLAMKLWTPEMRAQV